MMRIIRRNVKLGEKADKMAAVARTSASTSAMVRRPMRSANRPNVRAPATAASSEVLLSHMSWVVLKSQMGVRIVVTVPMIKRS